MIASQEAYPYCKWSSLMLTPLYWSSFIEHVKKCTEFFLVCRHGVCMKKARVICLLKHFKQYFWVTQKNKAFTEMTKQCFQFPIYTNQMFTVFHKNTIGVQTNVPRWMNQSLCSVWYFVSHLLFGGGSCWKIATRLVKNWLKLFLNDAYSAADILKIHFILNRIAML